MAHYTIHHADGVGVVRFVLDAICPNDQVACTLAARLLPADGRTEVRCGTRRIAAVLTTADAVTEINASRRRGRRKGISAPAPSWGRPDLFAPVEIPA
jgi:hypothetical protein